MFGVIFASDPEQLLREIERVLRPRGRALLSAWVPTGPIDAMLGAMGRIVGRITGSPAPRRFPWFDPDAVGPIAARVGLTLRSTSSGELPIRAASPEAYVVEGREHPMALAIRPVIEHAAAASEVEQAMTAVLREANEDPGAFLIHSPYVVHELGVTATVD